RVHPKWQKFLTGRRHLSDRGMIVIALALSDGLTTNRHVLRDPAPRVAHSLRDMPDMARQPPTRESNFLCSCLEPLSGEWNALAGSRVWTTKGERSEI